MSVTGKILGSGLTRSQAIDLVGHPAAIPAVVPTRTGDTTIGVGAAAGFPVTVQVATKVRRARLRVGTRSGALSVAAYDEDRARLVTSGAVQAGPAGAMEVALPPTTLQPEPTSLWVSTEDGTLTLGTNSTYGDLVGGEAKASGTHPLPASLSTVVPTAAAVCVSLLPDDPTPLAASPAFTRVDMGISVAAKGAGGRLYGASFANGHWMTSDDSGTTWTDRTYSPSVHPGSGGASAMVVTASYLFVATPTGKVFRNTLDVFNAWTDITPSGVPVGTTGRAEILHHNGTYLFYGNYNASTPGEAHVWRSADDGATWAEVLTVLDGRHVHAIDSDPANRAHVFVTIGDAASAGKGLYYSASNGAAASFARISSNRYGIGMCLPTTVTGVPSRILLEGDGLNEPHVMSFYQTLIGATGLTDALIWPDTNDDGRNWSGTVRSSLITSEGNLFYISTSEGGTVGSRDAIWMARGPWFTTPVLLEDLTGNVPAAYTKTFESGAYLINYRYRMTRPKFAGQ